MYMNRIIYSRLVSMKLGKIYKVEDPTIYTEALEDAVYNYMVKGLTSGNILVLKKAMGNSRKRQKTNIVISEGVNNE